MKFWIWVYIKAVEIDSIAICSVVPSIDSVRVDNWNNIEYKLFSKQPHDLRILQQPLQNPIHNMTPRHLPWMHPRTQKYSFFLSPKTPWSIFLRKHNLILKMFLLFLYFGH